MASPCEVLTDADRTVAARLLDLVAEEAWRIEDKFSRYLPGNVIHSINHGDGRIVELDEETVHLFNFADRLYQISEGAFDVTSGVLRKAWRFDKSDRIPTAQEIEALLPRIGWEKVRWDPPYITLRPGMEIDFGGFGKEYAVDRAARLAAAESPASTLINFGGDLAITRPREDGSPWRIGIESPDSAGTPAALIHLVQGGLATSGDAQRYLIRAGKRYSHILNPRTGWPVENAARSITVAANTCTEAGMLATLAMLRGDRAEAFLEEEGVRYWCSR